MGKAPCVHRDDGGWGSDNNNQLVTQDHLIWWWSQSACCLSTFYAVSAFSFYFTSQCFNVFNLSCAIKTGWTNILGLSIKLPHKLATPIINTWINSCGDGFWDLRVNVWIDWFGSSRVVFVFEMADWVYFSPFLFDISSHKIKIYYHNRYCISHLHSSNHIRYCTKEMFRCHLHVQT